MHVSSVYSTPIWFTVSATDLRVSPSVFEQVAMQWHQCKSESEWGRAAIQRLNFVLALRVYMFNKNNELKTLPTAA